MQLKYHRPARLDDALELLAQDDVRWRPVAYGTDLLVALKTRGSGLEGLIDLTRLEALRGIEATDQGLVVGPSTPLAELGRHSLIRQHFPVLARAIPLMGSVQLREGASLGGNICTASPAADTAPPLLCAGAIYQLTSTRGTREVAASAFAEGPGRTVMAPDELLTGVRLPWSPPGAVGTFLKAARRAAVDLALVSVAAVAWPTADTPSGVDFALALGAVAPTAVRALTAEALVRQHGLGGGPPRALGVGAAARQDASPIDDVRASAAYRLTLVGHLTEQACAELEVALAQKAQQPEAHP